MLYVVKLLYAWFLPIIVSGGQVFSYAGTEAVRTSAIAMKEYLGILAVKLGAQ